jgi:hypothetical protein
MFAKIFSKSAKKTPKSSDFSKFFREASSGQKKKVFLDVAKKASKEQLDLIQNTRLAR